MTEQRKSWWFEVTTTDEVGNQRTLRVSGLGSEPTERVRSAMMRAARDHWDHFHAKLLPTGKVRVERITRVAPPDHFAKRRRLARETREPWFAMPAENFNCRGLAADLEAHERGE